MSIEQRSWRRRNAKPRCTACNSRHTQRRYSEVDWVHRQIKIIWACDDCGHHIYVYAQQYSKAQHQQVA